MEWRACELSAYDACPSARMGHSATVVEAKDSWGEDLLVVFGGLSAEKKALGDIHVFQVQTQAWIQPKAASPSPADRAFHAAAAAGGKLYISGGHVFQKDRSVHKFSDLWCLDTDTWTWAQLAWEESVPFPCARDFHAFATLPGERLLLYAGLDSAEKKLEDTWIFDTNKRMWRELDLSNKPKARFGHAMARIDHQVLMCGGDSPTGAMNDIWALRGVVYPSQQEAPRWVQLDIAGTPFSARKAHAVAGVGMQVLFFGGHTSESGWFSRRQEVYHNDLIILERRGIVSWQRPIVSGTPPPPREFHTLTPLSSTKLLLFGGGNGRVIFRDAFYLCLPEGNSCLDQAVPSSDRPPELTWSQDTGDEEVLQDPNVQSTTDIISASHQTGNIRQDASGPMTPKKRISEDVLGFERLCRQLGAADWSARYDDRTSIQAFKQLGKEMVKEAYGQSQSLIHHDNSLSADSLARQYLFTTKTGMLRINDIAALLWDYKQICPGVTVVAKGLTHEAIIAAFEELPAGKKSFSHRTAESLTMRDVATLHAEYQQLCSSMGL